MCRSGKVLIVTPFYYPVCGGAETFAENLFDELSKKYKVDIATLSYAKPWTGQRTLQGLRVAYQLFPVVRKYTHYTKYDKIYALGLISSGVCRLLKLNYFSIILALYDFEKESAKVKWALGQAEKVFVEGVGGRMDMVKAGISPKQIVDFQHWVPERFKPIDREPGDKLKVIYVGRAIKIKGKHIIEQAEWYLKGSVDFHYVENVPYKNLHKYFQMADICVVPSLYSEGFSRVVAEAMSCGCVMITSNLGSLPEMLGDAGICIKPDAIEFYKEIRDLNRDRVRFARMRQKSISYANEMFNSKNAEVFL